MKFTVSRDGIPWCPRRPILRWFLEAVAAVASAGASFGAQLESSSFSHQYNGDAYPVPSSPGYTAITSSSWITPPSSDGHVLSYQTTTNDVLGYWQNNEWTSALNATGWTVEMRVHIRNDAVDGPEGAMLLYGRDGGGSAQGKIVNLGVGKSFTQILTSGGTHTVIDSSDNTDRFHVFRMAQAASSGVTTIWRDGLYLAGYTPASSSSSPFMFFGDGGGDVGGPTVELDYVRWTSGFYEPVPEPMSFVSCTAAQTSRTVPNFGLHDVLDLQVVTQGQTNPIVVTNLVLNTAGTTEVGDIARLQVFYTGGAAAFVSTNLFASYSGGLTGTIVLAGNQPLVGGMNHFWVACEPRRGAKWGHYLDAELLSVSVSGPDGGAKIPDVQAPPGKLTLGNGVFRMMFRCDGYEGATGYGDPGLVLTRAGTLIACFTVFWGPNVDGPTDSDVAIARSTDQGNTWGPTQLVIDFDKNQPGSLSNSVSANSMLLDRQTGTIWVSGIWQFGDHGYYTSGPGLSTNETAQYVLARSDDDGLTWSPPINITAQVKVNTNWGITCGSPGTGLQLRDGTLVFPSYYRELTNGEYRAHAYLVYSTNHGATWLTSPPANGYPPECNESQVVELNSGQLMISLRNYAGAGQRAWTTYTRGASFGDGAWSSISYTNPDPICQAGFIRYTSRLDGHPRDHLLFSNPASSSARTNLTVRLSEDEGQSWPVSRLLDNRRAGYSCMVPLNDGTMAILYQAGDTSYYETLTFARFSMDWLTQADLDSDGDGMSDYYEMINGLNPNLADAWLDGDGDGMSNLGECFSGTMANDPQSVLRWTRAEREGSSLRLAWASVPWMLYSIETSPSLLGGNWSVLPAAESVMATGATMTITVPLATESNGFYRVKAPLLH